MGRPIPEIRAAMHALADEMAMAGCEDWAILLHGMALDTFRNRAVRKAPITSHKMTEGRARAIRRYAQQHPLASQQSIADYFGLNPGRVSEALNRAKVWEDSIAYDFI